MVEMNERPGVEEQYSTAGNTSNLTVEADRRGAGDVLIAAGWNESRIGMALLRLHSEWNGLAKPRRPGKQALDVMAAAIKSEDTVRQSRCHAPNCAICKPKDSPMDRAQAEADKWFANELRLLANGLKSRAVVWEQLAPWIAQKGISPELAAEGLLHWLDDTCPKCSGLGLLKVPDQPALSARRCKCNAGKKWVPKGAERLVDHLGYCISVARGSLKKRLRPQE